MQLVRYLNATIQLLRVSLTFASEQGRKDERWTVVCSFLWASWQRLLMLELRGQLRRQLENGFECETRSLSSIRALDVLPEIFEHRREVLNNSLRETPYLCSWAYQNLINDWACVSTDLRYLHQIYHDCFGQRKAVCNPGQEQCSGLSSISCGRFENTRVICQSAHAQRCGGCCSRLFWKRESFVSMNGPRAVDIHTADATGLRYCASTENTLTVSHVWSHGQGGRPDHSADFEGTGLNSCLHHRYSEIALSLGYSSYWMDTACIPSEKDLRWECISQITRIFSASEATLICDRDIMTVDISILSVQTCEKALSILLVCDWNMRAWTLLEAMRGRRSLYLLCLDDKILNVHDAVQTVFSQGRLDIAVLFHARSYLLPPYEEEHFELFEGRGSIFSERELEQQHETAGFLTMNHAAVLLSSRHATRDDDDLLIWSLLIGDTEIYDPVQMWVRRIGEKIPTGSLVSSAPRLQGQPGFHWAPSRPTLPRRRAMTTQEERAFPAYDGQDTIRGEITEQGFLAHWEVFKFTVPILDGKIAPDTRLDNLQCDRIAEIIDRYLASFSSGILLQPKHARGERNVVPYQGSSDKILVVCGSHDNARWIWRGLYVWERALSLPQFGPERILLV